MEGTPKEIRSLSGVQYSGIELFMNPIVNHADHICLTTSSICDAMESFFDTVVNAISENNELGIIEQETLIPRLFKSLFKAWYQDVDSPYVFLINEDIARHFWALQNYIDPDMKHVFFYRPLADLVQCHVKDIEKDPAHFINVLLFKNGREQTRDNQGRAVYKVIKQHFFRSFEICHNNFELNKDYFIVDYRNISQLTVWDLCNQILTMLKASKISASKKRIISAENDNYINSYTTDIEDGFFSDELQEYLQEKDVIGRHL